MKGKTLREKLHKMIETDVVGKSAIENWFPNGRSLDQFNEIAYNRFYRLSDAILAEVRQVIALECGRGDWNDCRKAMLERIK